MFSSRLECWNVKLQIWMSENLNFNIRMSECLEQGSEIRSEMIGPGLDIGKFPDFSKLSIITNKCLSLLILYIGSSVSIYDSSEMNTQFRILFFVYKIEMPVVK
jgi:hypothetical protein